MLPDAWRRLSPEEIERRRIESVTELSRRNDSNAEDWYQRNCDHAYWKYGRCCAGCDHWHGGAGGSGQCDANGLVQGAEVLKSVGVCCASWQEPPGWPFTDMEHVCGKFQDSFDWSSLPREYLDRIGALTPSGQLKPKPSRNNTEERIYFEID